MAITLGTFTKQDDNSFTGTLKTLNVTATLSIVPVAKASDNAPDHRVYAGAGQRYEVGAGWSQVAKSSGETYLNLKIGAPEFGPHWVRPRLSPLRPRGARKRPRPFSSVPHRRHARHPGPVASPYEEDPAMDDEATRAARAKKGSPFLNTAQAAFYVGLSARTLEKMRLTGGGPRFRKHGRYVRYHIDDLDAWSLGEQRASTSDAGETP